MACCRLYPVQHFFLPAPGCPNLSGGSSAGTVRIDHDVVGAPARAAAGRADPSWNRSEYRGDRAADVFGLYSVHVRTRKFSNPEKTNGRVVPARRANSKTQGGTRIDTD